MAVGYYNFLAGILLLLMAICFILPMNRTDGGEREGFANDNSVSIKNSAIMNLFDGPLSRRVKKQKEEADEFRDIKKAKDKALELEEIKKFKKRKDNSNANEEELDKEDEDEEFTDSMSTANEGKSKNRKIIEQRKFNPADNDDMNLLMTQEICDDIQNRIKYVYEDKVYLKKYIREKLEEIVDILDLIPDNE